MFKTFCYIKVAGVKTYMIDTSISQQKEFIQDMLAGASIEYLKHIYIYNKACLLLFVTY